MNSPELRVNSCGIELQTPRKWCDQRMNKFLGERNKRNLKKWTLYVSFSLLTSPVPYCILSIELFAESDNLALIFLL